MTRPIRFLGRSRINESVGTGAKIGRVFAVLLVSVFPPVLYDELARRVPNPPSWPVALPFCSLVVCAIVPTRIHVTHDGVRIGWFGARFIPYDRIVTTLISGGDVVLELAAGETVRLPIRLRRDKKDDSTRGNELFFALNERRARFRSSRELRRSVGRNGRKASSWASHLCTSFHAGPFRSPAPNCDALWLLLEDGAAPPDVRVGAAVTLRLTTRATDQGARIKTIAKASASCVRPYLEAVSTWEGDGNSLAEILRPLAPDTDLA